jgi:hypothetical protein
MPTPDLQPGLPTICRDVNRLLLAVEPCVRNFSRCHKYQGADLRQQAMHMVRLALVQDLRLQIKPQMWVDKAHRGNTFIPFFARRTTI